APLERRGAHLERADSDQHDADEVRLHARAAHPAPRGPTAAAALRSAGRVGVRAAGDGWRGDARLLRPLGRWRPELGVLLDDRLRPGSDHRLRRASADTTARRPYRGDAPRPPPSYPAAGQHLHVSLRRRRPYVRAAEAAQAPGGLPGPADQP